MSALNWKFDARRIGAALFLFFALFSLLKNPVSKYAADFKAGKETRAAFTYEIFSEASETLVNGADPYPSASDHEKKFWDIYLYGPSFAFFFYPFTPAVLGPAVGMFAWLAFNCLFFWAGFSRFYRHTGLERFKAYWYIVMLALMFNELQASLRFQQSNGMIVGLTLFGLAFFLERRFVLSAACLAAGTHVKLFPVVFALLLGLELNAVFICSFFALLALSFLPPLAVVPPEAYLRMIKHWLGLFGNDPAYEMYDGLPAAILHYGLGISERAQTFFMLANALAIAVVTWLGFRLGSRRTVTGVVMPLGLSFVMLFNKRTETAGFILLCPVYAAMLYRVLAAAEKGETALKRLHIVFLAAGWVFSSFLFTDFFPRGLKDFADLAKVRTLGIAVIYIWGFVSAFLMLRRGKTASPNPL